MYCGSGIDFKLGKERRRKEIDCEAKPISKWEERGRKICFKKRNVLRKRKPFRERRKRRRKSLK